jgi:hypothetical protein
MSIEAPSGPTTAPALVAEQIQALEREVRRILPMGSPEVQALALQALDLGPELLDAKVVRELSSPAIPHDPEAMTAQAAWLTFARRYLDVLGRVRDVIQAAGSVASC